MKNQIILLAISILGAFSLHAQEINKSLTQSKKEVNSQPRKGTDWNKQPIGYVFGGVGVRSEERRVGKECRSRWSPYH